MGTLFLLILFPGIPILIICAIVGSIKRNKRQKREFMLKNTTTNSSNSLNEEKEDEPSIEPQNPLKDKYQACSLLTTTEYNFYTVLKELCDKENFLICPKVRLEDFINVTAQDRMKYRGHIKSRHVDFVICDSWLKIIAAIELDDASHNTQQAQIIDNFKNELFDAIEIPLFRIKVNDFHVIRITEMLEYIKELITKETAK